MVQKTKINKYSLRPRNTSEDTKFLLQREKKKKSGQPQSSQKHLMPEDKET